jgi:carnosine N-methyltransferase
MKTSFAINRLLTILVCIVFPFFIAIRASTLLSDIGHLLISLSERAEAFRIAFINTHASPSTGGVPDALKGSSQSRNATHVPVAGKKKPSRALPDGLAHTINSFEQYSSLANSILQRKHARYAKQSPAHIAISNKLGYADHFASARKGIEVNARFSDKIAEIARETYKIGPQPLHGESDAEFGLVDLAFGHLSRDWSAQGAKERQAVIPPILDGLEKHFGTHKEGKRVLVPGSGMGRLASNIADLSMYLFIQCVKLQFANICTDYDVTANELDFGSILTYHLLTNHTTSLHQHTLQPFVTKWTHQAKSTSRFTSLTVPDHWPNKAVKLVEGDFLEKFPEDGQFDAVATLFFIDMSNNVVDFLSNIHRLLKPGGIWINLGRKSITSPIQWNYYVIQADLFTALKWGSYAELQLSVEEVLQLSDLLGFDVDQESRKSIDSLYAEQPDTLLKFTYGKSPFILRLLTALY